MEKSTSTATPPPPPSATSSLPLPTASADQRSSPAMDLDTPPVPTRPHTGAQVAPTTDPSPRGRKRGLEGNIKMENSNYYKMRLLVKDLRPHVLEVLRTPDFRNCQAAIEIQDKMKLLLQLYQEMVGQTPKLDKTTNTHSSLSNGKAATPTPEPSTDNKHNNSVGDDKVVGGSAFGWNFVTYGGTEAVYCGLSKEEYRTSHPISQAGGQVEAQHHNTQL